MTYSRWTRSYSSARKINNPPRDLCGYSLGDLSALRRVSLNALQHAVNIGDRKHAEYYREWVSRYDVAMKAKQSRQVMK